MVLRLHGLGRHGSAFTIVIAGVLAALPGAAEAATPNPHPDASLIVGNDRGGLLTTRIQQVRNLLQDRRSVEIRGDICLSTCTMLLGLPDVCVSPGTSFGFHGPSYSGRPLDPDLFDRASRIIASFYPVDLRDWYLQTARFEIADYREISGKDLIEMGVKTCPQA